MTRNRMLAVALLVGVTFSGIASNALALTGACSTISNQATLAYSVGGVPQANILSDGDGNAANGAQSTDFTVDTKVDLSISTFNSPVNATGINQILTYRITNAGNDTQRYMLQLYAGNGETIGGATDNFNMSNVRVVVDTVPDGTISINADGTINLAADETTISLTAATDGTDLGLTPNVAGNVGVAPSNVLEVYVIADVPAGRATGDDALYTLKARTYQIAGVLGIGGVAGAETGDSSSTATLNSCSSQVVLADGAATDTPVGDPADASDAANDGDYFATGIFTVSAPTISVTKSQSILWDPVNLDGPPAPQAIPGAYVQYVITIANTGAASATLSTVTDPLASTLLIDPDLITGAGPGNPESLAGRGFHIVVTGSTRAAANTNKYFTTTSSVDGIDMVGATVTATFATILPAEGTYAAGELKSGETVTLTFNAIIQ